MIWAPISTNLHLLGEGVAQVRHGRSWQIPQTVFWKIKHSSDKWIATRKHVMTNLSIMILEHTTVYTLGQFYLVTRRVEAFWATQWFDPYPSCCKNYGDMNGDIGCSSIMTILSPSSRMLIYGEQNFFCPTLGVFPHGSRQRCKMLQGHFQRRSKHEMS